MLLPLPLLLLPPSSFVVLDRPPSYLPAAAGGAVAAAATGVTTYLLVISRACPDPAPSLSALCRNGVLGGESVIQSQYSGTGHR